MPNDTLLTEKRTIVGLAWLCEGGEELFRVGERGIKCMRIERTGGQGGWVPWVRIEYIDGRQYLYNAAYLLRIEYASGVNPDA